MAKYLQIRKTYFNDDYSWFLEIKPEYAMDTFGKKMYKFTEKVEAFFNGEAEEIKHGGKNYTVGKSKFMSKGKPVYLIFEEDSCAPCLLYTPYKYGKKSTSGNSRNADVCNLMIIDEDIETFEHYGYDEKRGWNIIAVHEPK